MQNEAFVSVVTIGEIEKGIARMPPSRRKTSLAAFLLALIDRFDDQIIDLDLRTMLRWGRMLAELEKRGRILPVIDSLIAATALEHDLTLVTRNTQDFAPTGIKVLNLWE